MTRAARTLSAAFGALALVATAGSAWADCDADFKSLMTKRIGEIEALNKISKAHGGKLDPVAGCPRLRSLAGIEAQIVTYVQKNGAWCGIPDDMAERMTATRAKTESFAAKACAFAAKVKQMQADQQKQAATQQPEQTVKLPTGPL